jgi:prevent-host-death family protein
MIVSMETIHISEAEAVRDFADVIARVRAGAEVVIESGSEPIATVRPAAPLSRSLSESIAIIDARAKERGYSAVLDPDFAADMEEIIANRKPRDTSAWD